MDIFCSCPSLCEILEDYVFSLLDFNFFAGASDPIIIGGVDITAPNAAYEAWQNGILAVSQDGDNCAEDEAYFYCGIAAESTDGTDHCGSNHLCPFGPCCYCGGCLVAADPGNDMNIADVNAVESTHTRTHHLS